MSPPRPHFFALHISGYILLTVLAGQFAHGQNIPVEVSRVVTRDVGTHLNLVGIIEPQISTTVSSETTGRLERLHVREGDRVRKDAVLAKLDSDIIEVRLAQTAARLMAKGPAAKKKYTDTFHEARYNLAICDYQYALSLKKDPARRSKYLLRAQKDITITASSYPRLGGPAWRAKYDRLLRKIQSARGEKSQGLGRRKAQAAYTGKVSR